MIAILLIITATSVFTAKLFYDEVHWLKSRVDYWYGDARFWREMWEAERTGDYDKLREVQELRKLETRSVDE